MNGVWLYLRLGFALLVLLAPGWAVARAIGVRGLSATLAWALTALFAAMGVMFLVHGSIWLAFVLLMVVGAVALAARVRAPVPIKLGLGSPGVVLAGIVLGILLWSVAGEIGGDGFFHLARVRKLLDLGHLSPGSVNEFPDGGLHPGYAFPLWHGFVALVAWVAGTDPTNVVRHLPSVLAPVAVLVWVETGWAVFRRRAAAIGTAAIAVTLVAFAPQGGGAYTSLALPATSSRQILAPAALALAFLCVRTPRPALLATAAAASFVLAVVHPSYVVFLWIPWIGFLAVRQLWQRRDLRPGLATLAATVVPAAAFIGALTPIIGDTVSVSPGADERARAFAHYAGQLHGTPDRFAVAPELFGRAGGIAVVALLLAPLALLAARRRWAAYVVGGGLAIMVVTLVPFLFTPFSDVVSVSQARRLVGFFPFALAIVGGLGVLASLVRWRLVAVAALAVGVGLRIILPGDFGYRLGDAAPGWITWISVAGLVVALGAGLVVRRARETPVLAAALLLAAPTVVWSLTDWSPAADRPPVTLTDDLIASIREEVPPGGIVYGDPEASYRLAAFAPVKICVAPPGHVADTVKNHPRRRVLDYQRYLKTIDAEIPRACGAHWILVDRERFPHLDPGRGSAIFRDTRWTVFALGP